MVQYVDDKRGYIRCIEWIWELCVVLDLVKIVREYDIRRGVVQVLGDITFRRVTLKLEY